MAKPAVNIRPQDKGKFRENAKLKSDIEKTKLPVTSQRLRPVIPVREASKSAPKVAPSPVELISSPKPRGPWCRIASAKIGISTVNGNPAKLRIASIIRSVLIALVPTTYLKHSLMFSYAEVVRGTTTYGPSYMASSPAIRAI